MDIKQNNSFKSVEKYGHISIKDILSTYYSLHLKEERKQRIDIAVLLNALPSDESQAEVDEVFLVDKGHKDGKELHCVTKRGIIFILNERKYLYNGSGFITALVARPNQVIRLYKECGMYAPRNIIDICNRNKDLRLNHT